MSSAIKVHLERSLSYEDCPSSVAVACHCWSCEQEGMPCFHIGLFAMKLHEKTYPTHDQVTWLKERNENNR